MRNPARQALLFSEYKKKLFLRKIIGQKADSWLVLNKITYFLQDKPLSFIFCRYDLERNL